MSRELLAGTLLVRALMAAAARMYFVQGASKTEIGDELGVSRFKVARLLEDARESGMVTVSIDDTGLPDLALSDRLREALRLQDCIVVTSRGTIEDAREQVGAAAAEILGATVKEGDVIGFSWGRTLGALTRALRTLPPVTVVQLTGSIGGDLSQSPVEIVRAVSQHTGGTAHAIHAPLFVSDAQLAAGLRRDPVVNSVLSLFPRLTTAVLSVGSWEPPMSQLREIMTEPERALLHEAGVQAEVAGILIDADGRVVDEGFSDRCLSITAAELSVVPRVLAVGGGTEKARAVLACARSGLVTSLVTDHHLAHEVLRITGSS